MALATFAQTTPTKGDLIDIGPTVGAKIPPLTVTDSSGTKDTQTLTWTINPAITITTKIANEDDAKGIAISTINATGPLAAMDPADFAASAGRPAVRSSGATSIASSDARSG